MVSGLPTQLVMAAVLLVGLGVNPLSDDGLDYLMSLEFIAVTMLLDTALTALLLRIFLAMSGEDSRAVFIGKRPVFGEILRGIALVPLVFVGVTIVVLGIRTLFPWMHNVAESPMLRYMDTPFETVIFLVVVTLGGGIKEELQRAFVLHRFEHYLGGRRVGLIVFSALFGILHYPQGIDVSVSIGLLGLFWGVLYLKRRSAILTMANHATFNAAQVAQAVLVRSLGA